MFTESGDSIQTPERWQELCRAGTSEIYSIGWRDECPHRRILEPLKRNASKEDGEYSMTFSSNKEIYDLVKAFERRTLPRYRWTHEAHLAVATFYCSTLPFGMARNVMRDGILWLNDLHGTPNNETSGYHETLTLFWLKRVWNFIDSRIGHAEMTSLVNDVIKTLGDPDLPLRFYSRDLLYSAKARREYYPPDVRLRPALVHAISLAMLKPLT